MGVSNMLQRVLNLISRPPSDRGRTEIDVLLPWLRRRSKLMKKLEREVLITLMKNCQYTRASKDDVLIQQGDVGDCFYVMLTGRTSVYIDPLKSGEENALAQQQSKQPKEAKKGKTQLTKSTTDGEQTLHDIDEEDEPEVVRLLDRSQFGRFIMHFDAGQSFGEIALMTKESLRNASIVADEDADLLVIQRDLFNGTLKARQEEEYAERHAFIRSCRLFDNWTPKFKRLLEMSIRKESFMFDSLLVQQGEPVIGMHFIIRGQAKQIVDPSLHKQQYPKLFDGSNSILAKELGKAFEKKEKKLTGEKCSLNEQIRVRRREGYAAAERRLALKSTTVCFLDESEIIGALEVVLGLETYAHSVRCTSSTDVFILDLKNIDRLITKRNAHTLERLRKSVEAKLRVRLNRHSNLEVYSHLLQKAVDMQHKQPTSGETLTKKDGVDDAVSRKEAQFNQMLRLYMDNKSPLIQSNAPDGMYYMVKQIDKARRPPSNEIANKKNKGLSPEMRLQRAKKFASHRRQARSRRELEQMTIANEVEQFQLKDQDHAVNRYLTPTRHVNREYVHEEALHDQDHIFKLTDPGEAGDAGVYDEEGRSRDQMVLSPGELSRIGVRNAVFELAGLQSASKATRARIICAMIERRQQSNPDAIQRLMRPKSAPSRNAFAGGGSDSDSEVGDFDQPTGETALNDLEMKIRDFHTKNTKEGTRPRMQVASLRRFTIQNPDDVPVPGGTVFVKQRACAYPPGSRVDPAHHVHVRRFIVPRNAAEIAAQSMRAFERQAITALQDDAKSSSSSGRSSSPTNKRLPKKQRAQSAPSNRPWKPERPPKTKTVTWT
ncbi:hypothetical protein CAPTEDRAFT_222490 [Capitella teleta]|uniref:Cyclic nucleotide-binding domain-containing protein n=1 Tax=Capitella teleta TaxID=283909 RepID=R7TZA6_CAPTE|nr:hypothetical protein CAPTEDRAFT_222490 [Capitella teleta]|eukprot:ELT96736.1 hypothetical protein CAPTEDRAFT_222490 [Capitella teleta]